MSGSAAAMVDVVARLRAAGSVFAEQEADLFAAAAATPADLVAMVDRRVAGEPVEHIVGWAEFDGVRVVVEPGVFVPRHRTAFLVERAERLCRVAAPASRPLVVVDLCCGSGALGLALAARLRRRSTPVELHASDVDPAAVRCARRNLHPIGGRVHQGDLFDALPAGLRGRVDLLLANVPYVPTDAVESMPREARLHEPRVALDGGADGLDVVRRVAAAAPAWLAPGGGVSVETGARQASSAAAAFAGAGLVPETAQSEDHDATVVTGTAHAC